MAGIFDYLPEISIAMFVLGLVGVMAYERTRARSRRPRQADRPPS